MWIRMFGRIEGLKREVYFETIIRRQFGMKNLFKSERKRKRIGRQRSSKFTMPNVAKLMKRMLAGRCDFVYAYFPERTF